MNLEILPSERSCGPCTACCVQLPLSPGTIGPQPKLAGTPCPHLDVGCSIYIQRPAACANFRCAWLRFEAWPPQWRPYESGLLCLWEMLDLETPMAAVYELREQALESTVGASIIDWLLGRSLAVSLVDLSGQRRLLAASPVESSSPESIDTPQMPSTPTVSLDELPVTA